MNPTDFANLLRNGNPPANRIVSGCAKGLCGRIIRGVTPQHFERLSDDPSRLVVMLTDSAGLESMPGKTGYEMLITVGHHPDHIKSKLATNHTYKFVLFPEGEAFSAVWDNAFKIASQVYPDLRPFFYQNYEALKAGDHTPSKGKTEAFRRIEALAGYSFMDADKKDDPRFMSYENYLKSGKGVVATRALFYHALHLRELYTGDGFTYDENGRKGVAEYFMLNKPIREISGAVVLDLDVRLPNAA
jgi:hypothetical protein